MSMSSISREYDILYEEGKKVFAKYNPCAGDGRICIHVRVNKSEDYINSNIKNSRCCSGCKHLGKNGCRVKALWCKLWSCLVIRTAYPELAKELEVLNRRANKLHLLYSRGSKRETLLYYKKYYYKK